MELGLDRRALTSAAPEFAGPKAFANLMMKLRRIDPAPEAEGAISEKRLELLLELAFYVSLTTEEGRHPHFRLFVAAPDQTALKPPVTIFDPAIRLTTDVLRRLVPAVSSRSHALWVREDEDGLLAQSIVGVDDSGDQVQVGRPELSMSLGFVGLMVRVDGPGRMRVTEKGATFELVNGVIEPVYHYTILSVVRRWFADLATSFLEQTGVVSAVGMRDAHGDPAYVFDGLWSFVLSKAVSAGHGGAFVVLPNASHDGIRIKYPSRKLDLTRAALDYWQACFDIEDEPSGSEVERKADVWEAAKRRMLSSARALADLSNVDGCVVLDRRLHLFGFGGEIRVSDDEVRDATCSEAHPDTLEPRGLIDVQQWGTRHRSAFRLCAARPGTIAFVISQDGELKVFYGHRDRQVLVWRSIGAWLSGSDHW